MARRAAPGGTFQAADTLRKSLTRSLADAQFTTLKWMKAFIQVQAPAARGEIDRLEADRELSYATAVVVATSKPAPASAPEPQE